MAPWVYTPHSGGKKIPPNRQEMLRKKIASYSCERPWYPEHQLVARFKSQFCYIDTTDTDDNRTFPLCRLRYFSDDNFSMALFTYSNERYERCFFSNGQESGTLVEALETCEPFIF